MQLYHRAQNNWNTDKKTLVYETREGYIFGCRKEKTHSGDAEENKDCLIAKKKPDWGSVTSEVICSSFFWEKRHWPNSHGNNWDFHTLFWSGSTYICVVLTGTVLVAFTGFAFLPYYYHLPYTHPGAKKLLSYCPNSTAVSVQPLGSAQVLIFTCLPAGTAGSSSVQETLGHRQCLHSVQFANQKDKSPVLQFRAPAKHLPVGS